MKKTWIKVKRGVLDPKHRRKMGLAIYVYLYIIDNADWNDGIYYDWTDKNASDETEIPYSTLREYRHILEEGKYIEIVRCQHSINIIIKNWTNPREYSGQVYNPNDEINTEINTQINIEKNIQVNTQKNKSQAKTDVPSYNHSSHITDHNKDIPPKVEYDPFSIRENSPTKKAVQVVTPLSTLKPDQLILAEEFISLWKVPAPPKSQINYWRRGLYDFVQICGGEDPKKVMGETFRAWKKEGCRFSVSTPNSILRYAGAVIGKRKTSNKTYIGADGEILDEGGNRIVFDGMTVN